MPGIDDILESLRAKGQRKLSLPRSFDPIEAHTRNRENKSTVKILHAALECGMPNTFGMIGVGGVGSFLSSLTLVQQAQENIDARTILPYYPKLHGHLSNLQECEQVEHWYDGVRAVSVILKHTTAQSNIEYLVKPLLPGHQLFDEIDHSAWIYSDVNNSLFIKRIAYFCGAVTAFAMVGENSYLPHIVQSHSWALSFVGKLMAEYRVLYGNKLVCCSPQTIFTAHSAHATDGIYDFAEIPDIGFSRSDKKVMLSKVIINWFDHVVYVSEQLLKESIMTPSLYSQSLLERYLQGHTSAILNNIFADHFDPSQCLPKELTFDLDLISDGKQKSQHFLNQNCFNVVGKHIKLGRPLTIFLGRIAEEKGIARLDDAIYVTIENEGSFICMGLGDHPIIHALKEKYKDHPNVIFVLSQEAQDRWGKLIRVAADIYVVPSIMESCGLVPMEANIAGAIVVASRVGGLVNVIKPDANGMLFTDDASMRATLSQLQQKWLELYESGDLNIMLKLIQESARKSFDWRAPKVGSATAYTDLYQDLECEDMTRARFERGETDLTLAIIKRKQELIDRLIEDRKKNRKPNNIGLTPLDLAIRLNMRDLAFKIRAIQEYEYNRGDIVIILNVAFEYKQVRLGGVGEVVTAFCESINNNLSRLKCESRIITPHYPWHDELIRNGKLPMPVWFYNVEHKFDGKMVRSVISLINNFGTLHYLVKPQPGQNLEWLFAEVQIGQSNKIYDAITPKMAYFNSAVAGFLSINSKVTPKIHVLMGHSWGCGLTANLLRKYYKQAYPKVVFVVHSEFSEQGLIPYDHEHIHYLHNIGLDLPRGVNISPLIESAAAADHVVTVSYELAAQAHKHRGPLSVSGFFRYKEKMGGISAIINNITRNFDPVALKQDMSDLVNAKIKAKHKFNDFINNSQPINSDEITCMHGKYIDPNKTLVICIGRILHEKGINNIEAGIEASLSKNGCFIFMGLYGGGAEDQVITELMHKYKDNKNVIILHEKSYTVQAKYGPLARFAADLTFIPSHRESCGLVSMEAQLNASLVVCSDVGGLNDTVRHGKNGFMFKNGKEGYIKGRRNTPEVTKAVEMAFDFIAQLKQDHAKHNLLLHELHDYSENNYIWDGANGTLVTYSNLFNKLLCDNVMQPGSTTNFDEKDIYSGLPMNFLHVAYSTSSIFELPGYAHYLMRTTQGDILGIFSSRGCGAEKQLSELGRGSLATVYHGMVLHSTRDPDSVGKMVAIKKLRVIEHSAANTINMELNISISLGRTMLHYIDTDKVKDWYKYLFLKVYAGDDLEVVIANRSLIIKDKLKLSIKIVQNLVELHDAAVLHLDLNPRNIKVEIKPKENELDFMTSLIDFGTSNPMPSGVSYINIDGQPENAPAEIFNGLANMRTDVYGMGICIATMFLECFGENLDNFNQYNCQGELLLDRKAVFLSSLKPIEACTPKDKEILQDIILLLCQMLNHIDVERPLVVEVATILNKIYDKYLRLDHDLSFMLDMHDFCEHYGFEVDDLNKPNIYGQTRLHIACGNNCLQIVHQLLHAGALQYEDEFGKTPLWYAVRANNFNMSRLLLENGANPHEIYDLRLPYQIVQLFKGYEFLTTYGFSLADVNRPNNNGHTPLTLIYKHRELFPLEQRQEIAKIMIMLGAKVNAANAYSFLPIYFVLNSGDKQDLHDLLALGAKCPDIDNDIYRIHNFLVKNNFSKFKNSKFNLLGNTPLTQAIVDKDHKMAATILAFEPELLDRQSHFGNTPIYLAAEKKLDEILEWLLSKYPKLYIKNVFGQTVLDICKDKTLLINHLNKIAFSDTDEPNAAINSALQQQDYNRVYAVSVLHPECLLHVDISIIKQQYLIGELSEYKIRILYDLGIASILGIDIDNELILTLKFMQQNGFNNSCFYLELPNSSGHIPLTRAAELKDVKMCRLLIKYGANINGHNSLGNTALHNAVDTKDIDLIEALIELGINQNWVNNDGYRAHELSGIDWCDSIDTLVVKLKQDITDAKANEIKARISLTI